MNDQAEVLQRWHVRAKGAQTAHLEMTARYRRLNNLIGLPTAALAAALGTTRCSSHDHCGGRKANVRQDPLRTAVRTL